ncbi:uncharacterized protein LOC131690541 [Topomyia yanbarensis]|uniref:uncharacterized protein LOC131690541 n=1 Tax=Topomyia yanbarensis TaxID=2498891 RepID=UPI00273AE4CF|nr:uncharacterized protein LOC131690541 [Topomyia yanbarensis]
MAGRKKRNSSSTQRKSVQFHGPSKSNASIDTVMHPSYSNFQVPYPVICRQRYHWDKLRYDKQFEYELKMLELMQNSAYDSMRFHRHVAITTLWPPLHTRKEIEFVLNNFFRLPDKQTRRLKKIMNSSVY